MILTDSSTGCSSWSRDPTIFFRYQHTESKARIYSSTLVPFHPSLSGVDAHFLLQSDKGKFDRKKKKKFLHETGHSKLCGLFWVIRSIYLESFSVTFVLLYWREGKHVNIWHLQNSTAQTKTIEIDNLDHRAEEKYAFLILGLTTSLMSIFSWQ